LRAAFARTTDIGAWTEAIQKTLFRLGAALATAPEEEEKKADSSMTAADVDELTDLVHKIEATPGILSDWSLPGAHTEAAAFEISRTVCRRAERQVVRLMESGDFRRPPGACLSEPLVRSSMALRQTVGRASRRRF